MTDFSGPNRGARSASIEFVAAAIAGDAATCEIAELVFDRYAYARLETAPAAPPVGDPCSAPQRRFHC
jgi:hypothetical protein